METCAVYGKNKTKFFPLFRRTTNVLGMNYFKL